MEELTVDDYRTMLELCAEENKQLRISVMELRVRLSKELQAKQSAPDPDGE